MNSRKNNRLEFYDYSQNGAYFVTICAKDKQKIFWNNQQCSVGAVSGRPQDKLNHLGLIVKIGIEKIPLYYQNITVDKYVIMPNHVHLIIRIDNNDINGRPMTAPTEPPLRHFVPPILRRGKKAPIEGSCRQSRLRGGKNVKVGDGTSTSRWL